MKVLIDNGHGVETPGKRSPDGRLREYLYTREIADRVVTKLKSTGVDVIRIVPEETDVPLSVRVERANRIYEDSGKKPVLVSIHCNAMGSGAEWMPACGWSVFVGKNASEDSKRFASEMAQVALKKKVKVRQLSKELFCTADLYICQKTKCPAILVENFFQDNEEDVKFLLSEEGKQCVTDITVEGIQNYLKTV